MQKFPRILEIVISACKTNAAICALAIIVVIEIVLSPYLAQNFISHEVDETIRQLEKAKNNQPVVILGDSVGRGIFSGWKFRNGNVASLACNQATETAGQYFFLKRFLERNIAPGVVVSCDRTPLAGNLNQNLTENYIQRCFTRWSEILDLMLVKMDPVFTVKMIAYKLFSTFKYRLHLQKKIAGFSNSDIYSGVTTQINSSKSDYGLIKVLAKLIAGFRQDTISQHYFKKMLSELEKLNIPFLYLPPPSRSDNEAVHRLIQSSEKQMGELSKKFSNLSIAKGQYHRLPKSYFSDDVHLNQNGLDTYRPLLQRTMEEIISASIRHRHQMMLKSFENGQTVFAIDIFEGKNILDSMHDVVVTFAEGKQVVESVGNDPALLLPVTEDIDRPGNLRIAIKIDLTSSVSTNAKLYFASKASEPFTEINSLKQTTDVGRNTLFFVLPKEAGASKLRFDPGECTGRFVLEAVEVRSVDEKFIQPFMEPAR